MGFRTSLAGGGEGGIAPAFESISFVPNILGGTNHDFEMTFETTDPENPLEFILGHFDGDISTGQLNGTGITILADTPNTHLVPETISLALDLDATSLFSNPLNTSFGMTWDASEPADVTFAYLEEETDVTQPPDFNTAVTVQPMPVHEELTLSLSSNPGFTLSHRGSDVIDVLTFQHERDDGLTILGTATDIPTEVDLDVDLSLGGDTAVVLDVNDPTLDLLVEILQDGGFASTDAALGFDLGYLSVGVTDAVDLVAGFSTTSNSFSVEAVNPGESIGAVEVVGDDDASFDGGGNLVGLNLPPSWNDDPLHHIISFFDDGVHGTAAARLVHVQEAQFDFGSTDITEAYHLVTTQAAPLQAYLELEQGATLLDNVPAEGVMITGDVDNVPAGELDFFYEAPTTFGYQTIPPQGIDSVRFFGNIGTLNFDVGVGDLPPVFEFDFDPAGSLTVVAEDGFGGPDEVGFATVRLWDELSPTGLPNTSSLLGVPLRDAIARVDEIPSFHATWSDDAGGTNIQFDTDAANAFLGGAQFIVSTMVEADFVAPLAAPDATTRHFARFEDEGGSGVKRLGAGAFGIDHFSYSSNDAAATFELQYDAEADRELEVIIDAAHGGPFFPAYSVQTVDDATPTLFVDDVPQTFDVMFDLDPEFHYMASDEIEAITIDAYVDETNNGMDDGTTIDFDLEGLPDRIDFVLNPASDATLDMSNGIDEISVRLESNVNIFGTGFQLISATLENIPAKWEAIWAGELLLEAKNAADMPAPMGQVSVLISKTNDEDDNNDSLALFDNDGFTAGRSTFQETIDDRYWPAGVNAALDDLYGDTEKYDPLMDEDHVLTRGGSEFISAQFTGFQKIALTPNSGGGTFEFNAPVIGLHPLFVGLEDGGEFTNIQIENVPDNLTATLDIPNQFANLTFTDDEMDSPGEIDVYLGPVDAGDADAATRIVINDTPNAVTLSWDIGFPNGNVNFDASDPFQLLLLNQTGSQRIAAGLEMEDLQIGYGVSFPFDLDIDGPDLVELEFGSADLRVIEATAGIDNDVSDNAINGNDDLPGVSGFFGLYDLINAPSSLDGGIAPDGAEYVPQVTLLLDELREFSITVALDVELAEINLALIPLPALPPTPELDVDIVIDNDGLVFDVWATETIEETFDVLGLEFGFLNPADYIDNSPFHILPINQVDLFIWNDLVFGFNGLHDEDDHFDPFA